MTPIEKLRRIADMTALEGVADAIREVADEMERERNDPLMVAHALRVIAVDRAGDFNDTFYLKYVADMLEDCPVCRGFGFEDGVGDACPACCGTGKRTPHAPKGAE